MGHRHREYPTFIEMCNLLHHESAGNIKTEDIERIVFEYKMRDRDGNIIEKSA